MKFTTYKFSLSNIGSRWCLSLYSKLTRTGNLVKVANMVPGICSRKLYHNVPVSPRSAAYLNIVYRSTSPSCAFRLRMLPGAINYVLLAEDFGIFFATTCQTMVDVRSVSPVLTSGTHFLSISAINVNSCLQALTKDISTPADIAPSALETIIFYCFFYCFDSLGRLTPL